ncbi:MAG: methionyl-tRNA formyltransferase [Rikenellaceae bacterium]
MNAKDIRIVFMGTPEFAVPSLRALVESGYNVVGVVTTPDRAAGRGQKIYECDVKVEAMRLGLPILQPEKLKSEEFVEALRAWNPDLGIVIAFRMLPEKVWSMPQFGTFNLHASLLPQYRGAAPINHAIINGDTVSGVTTFLLNHEIDKGAIIGQIKVAIEPEDNVGSLYERLMKIGTGLVTESVDKIAAGQIEPIEQSDIDESTLRPAPKIFKEDCKIDWSWDGVRIVNFIRGLSPYPAAWSELISEENNTTFKIFEAAFEPSDSTKEVGTIECDDKSRLAVKCNNGFIVIKSLQIAGKKRLNTKDLLLGMKGLSLFKTR